MMSAGAIAIPQILRLSGIGPSDKVKKHLKELPGIGENPQDHLAIGIMYNVPTADCFISSKESLFSILVNSGCIDDSGNVISSSDNKSGELPDLKIVPVHINYRDPPIPFEAGVFFLKVGLMLPASRGSMSLASENPLDRPTCDIHFLSDPADLAVMRKGIKLTKRIGEKMIWMPLSGNSKDHLPLWLYLSHSVRKRSPS
ncbi:hypothetical protein CVT25_003605 [Psilocybe cyanescens]|uniref:Glucose-methanol-choline oxidoreductase C-terminal domain-containing protein n=1 Tax=Psilocybe cyanescens TaxID=93625 RepID=A0A409WZY1_PSICY|nr:hypothetical protein CVT25_003605 [Psilocybe cyanescens]